MRLLFVLGQVNLGHVRLTQGGCTGSPGTKTRGPHFSMTMRRGVECLDGNEALSQGLTSGKEPQSAGKRDAPYRAVRICSGILVGILEN